MVKWEKVYTGEDKQIVPVVRPDSRKPVKLVKTVDGLKRESDPSRQQGGFDGLNTRS